MSLYTADEIKAKITELDTAISTVVANGRAYMMNDSHGTIQVTRENLKALRETHDWWVQKYNELDGDADIVSVRVGR